MSDRSIQVKDYYALGYARELVWERLNDPLVLADCIRGCSYVERSTRHDFTAVIQARIGEIHRDFHVDLVVDDIGAPAKYTLSTEISAGVFGRVSGKADVRLDSRGEAETGMSYFAHISGTGLVGKVLPLLEGIAQRRVREFFKEFVRHLSAREKNA